MLNNNAPKFDGVKWRCPKCQSVLATVVKTEKFSLPTMEKTMVAAIELPSGYIKPSDGVWCRPNKYLPFGRGAQNHKSRIKTKHFRERKLENAIKKNDPASIVQSQMDLAQIAANAAATSSENKETKPVRLCAEELPAQVKCPKRKCDHVACLASIKARPNMPQRDSM